jgi:DNA-binding NarL/FixJ family response regulator
MSCSLAYAYCMRPRVTPREKEVLQLIREGMTSREIAKQLHIGVSTVASHRITIMKKLRARNRSELLMSAIQKNIISPEITLSGLTNPA